MPMKALSGTYKKNQLYINTFESVVIDIFASLYIYIYIYIYKLFMLKSFKEINACFLYTYFHICI